MKHLFNLIVVIAVVVNISGCEPAEVGLVLDKRADDGASGIYLTHDTSVSFNSTTDRAGTESLEVGIEETKLVAEINVINGTLLLDGHHNVLSSQQKELLQSLSNELEETFSDDAPASHEISLVQLLSYWAQAPQGYVYGRRQVEIGTADGSTNRGDDGIRCIRKGTWVTARYDDRSGHHQDSVKVNSTARPGYECMGRCGPGCGSWWAVAKAWTQDCMDHDQCSNVNYSSGGSSDSNCGDEYDEAADDWLWGVWNGCDGN